MIVLMATGNTPVMTVAHLGIAVFVIGITFTTVYSVERDVRMDRVRSISLR